MGDLIDFQEYRRKREEEEIEKLKQDLKYVMDRLGDADEGYSPLWYDVMSFPIFGDSLYQSRIPYDGELDGYELFKESDFEELVFWTEDD